MLVKAKDFGSITASVHSSLGVGIVMAGDLIVHQVRDAQHAAELRWFWQRQRAASSGAIMEALGWLEARLQEVAVVRLAGGAANDG